MEAANKVVTTAVERLSEAAKLVKKKEEEYRIRFTLFLIEKRKPQRENKVFGLPSFFNISSSNLMSMINTFRYF